MRSLKGASPVPVASVNRPAAHHIVTVGLGVVREIQGCKSKSKDSSEKIRLVFVCRCIELSERG